MPGRDQSERISRLEEALAFAERSGERLGEELAQLNRLMSETNRRLDTMERRLAALAAPEEPEED